MRRQCCSPLSLSACSNSYWSAQVSVLVMLFKHQGLGLIKPLPGVTTEIYRPQLDWKGLALLGVLHPKPALPSQPSKDGGSAGGSTRHGAGSCIFPHLLSSLPCSLGRTIQAGFQHHHTRLDFWGALGAASLMPSGFVGCHCQKLEVKAAVILEKDAMASPG